jgi:hypothetical protein
VAAPDFTVGFDEKREKHLRPRGNPTNISGAINFAVTHVYVKEARRWQQPKKPQ